jgi:hypothetical protein
MAFVCDAFLFRLEPSFMWRIALLGLLLSLTGCVGFGGFLEDTHTFQSNPNMPPGDSENMRRAMGQDTAEKPLTPEPGNIWPPPAGPMPTLMDLEQQTGQNATPGAPQTPRGSGTPPPATGYGGTLPSIPGGGLGPEAPMAMPKATTMPGIQPSKPPTTYPTSPMPSTTTGSFPGYNTVTTPQGQSIVVPNGNGTSTIIHPDGTVETVPTPKP